MVWRDDAACARFDAAVGIVAGSVASFLAFPVRITEAEARRRAVERAAVAPGPHTGAARR